MNNATPPCGILSRNAELISRQLSSLLRTVYEKMDHDPDQDMDTQNIIGIAKDVCLKLNTMIYELNISINPEDE